MENRKNEETSTQNAHYGLFTATTMIVGIVIGSGIFFKSDDILNYTGGNILLGVLVFCIGAFGIIFGSLTLTELSVRTARNGGIVGYYEDFVSPAVACGFGWFQTFIYFPTLTAVLAWVGGIYTCLLFNIPQSLETQTLFGLFYMVFFYALNVISLKSGGYFQNATTVIKLIPLLGIALAGIFMDVSKPALDAGIQLVKCQDVGLAWLAALAPIAFSFDGWIIATSITGEVKNPKKNMTLALIIGPIIVLAVYLLFFLGLNRMLGAEYILSARDAAIDKAGELLLGSRGTKILLSFVVISVLGVVNGVILGGIRMPQAMASKQMIPGSERVAKLSPKTQLSNASCVIAFVSALIWMAVHYITQKTNALAGGDISEISIVFSYGCYIILYLRVIGLKKEKVVSGIFKGIICPLFAILGAAIIFVGGFISNPIYVLCFMVLCTVAGAMGFLYFRSKNKIK